MGGGWVRGSALIIAVTLAGAVWFAVRWAATPAAVPDLATVLSGTQGMAVAGPTELAQRVVPRRDRLTAIDLLLAAERPDLPGRVQLEVLDWPSRQPLRLARLPAAALPARPVWEIRPGQPGERWTAFGFEPIDDAAGRELLMVLSYREGVDRPGERVVTLAHFPGTYPDGELLVNGFAVPGGRANLLFRLAGAGTRGAAVAVALDNLARSQPVFPGTLVFPAAAGTVCVALAIAVLTRLR